MKKILRIFMKLNISFNTNILSYKISKNLQYLLHQLIIFALKHFSTIRIFSRILVHKANEVDSNTETILIITLLKRWVVSLYGIFLGLI